MMHDIKPTDAADLDPNDPRTARHFDLQARMSRACDAMRQAAEYLDMITGHDFGRDTGDDFSDVCPETHMKAMRKLSDQLVKRERDLYRRACKMDIAW